MTKLQSVNKEGEIRVFDDEFELKFDSTRDLYYRVYPSKQSIKTSYQLPKGYDARGKTDFLRTIFYSAKKSVMEEQKNNGKKQNIQSQD